MLTTNLCNDTDVLPNTEKYQLIVKLLLGKFLNFNSWKNWFQAYIVKCHTALCSRNFQNVKLRLDFIEKSFYCHSDFTWNQILPILEVLNFDFSKLEQLSSAKFTKFQGSEFLKLPQMTSLDCLNMPKFDFT